MGIIEILGVVLGGGATGLFGTLASRLFGFFENRQRYEHELQLLALQARIGSEEREHEGVPGVLEQKTTILCR